MTLDTPCPICGRNTLRYFAKSREHRCTHEECGEIIPADGVRSESVFVLEPIPSFVAVPVAQWLGEPNPVLRLWRISDAVEILLRYTFSIALADLLRRCGGTLPSELKEQFRDSISKPTYRVWVDLTRQALAAHDELATATAPLIVTTSARAGMLAAVFPLIGNNDDDVDTHLLPLRNLLAHGGGMTHGAARKFLDDHGHEARAQDALRTQLGWLGSHIVTYTRSPGDYLELRGVEGARVPKEELSAALREKLDAHPERVTLVNGEIATLDLSPLCGFGIPEMPRKGKPTRRGSSPVTEIYIRSQTATILYNAIGAEIPLSERGGEAFERLSLLFADTSMPVVTGMSATTAIQDDFEAELQADAEAMRGRATELSSVLKTVLARKQGILWIAGRAGIGKSTFMAAVARHPWILSQRHILVVTHRFKAGDARCSRRSFLQRAVDKLERWHEMPGLDESAGSAPPVAPLLELDDAALDARLGELLRRISGAPQKKHAPRVVFLLDGLDEIARVDPRVLGMPRQQAHTNVLWLCAGRPEPQLNATFTGREDVHDFFPAGSDNRDGGLPPLSENGVREILLEGVSALRYEILQVDQERENLVRNEIVEAVSRRADGLPIYVKLVIDDFVRGNIRISTALEELPPSLEAYYEELLRRYDIDDLHQVLTPLAATLAIAREPLDEAALHALLTFRTLVEPGEGGRALTRRAIETIGPVLRRALTNEGLVGYMPYHTSFRSHIAETSDRTRQAVLTARRALADAAIRGWNDVNLKAVCPYLFRAGIRHMMDVGEATAAEATLANIDYLIARVDALNSEAIFGLRADMLAVPGTNKSKAYVAWHRLLDRYGHLIARGGATTLFERAFGEGDTSEVTLAAQRLLARGDWTRPWFRRANRPQIAKRDACKRTLQGHTSGVRAVAVHPEGKRVLSGGEDFSVKIWNRDTGICIRTLEGHAGRVNSIATSQNGHTILSTSEDGTLRYWDIDTGACLRTLTGPGAEVTFAVILADNRRAVSSGIDGSLCVWDLEAGTHRILQREGSHRIETITMGPGGQRVLVACGDTSLEEWDLATGALVRKLSQKKEEWADSLISVAVYEAEGVAVAGGHGGVLQVWDIATGECLRNFRGHFRFATVTSIATSTRVMRMISADDYGTLAVSGLQDSNIDNDLRAHPRGFTAVAIDPDGSWAVSGGSDGAVRIWDLEAGADAGAAGAHGEAVFSVAVHPNGKLALSASRDRVIYWWDTETCAVVGSRMGPTFSFYCAVFDPRAADGRRALAGLHGSFEVWDADNYDVGQGFEGHTSAVFCADANAISMKAISGDTDGGLKAWALLTEELSWNLQGHTAAILSVAIDESGQRAVSSDQNGQLASWNLENGECLRAWQGHEGAASSVVIGVKGQTAVSGGTDGTIAFWDLFTGECTLRIHAHSGGVAALSLHPNGSLLASAGADNSIKLWDPVQRKILSIYQTEATVRRIAIATSSRIVYGDNIGRVEFVDWLDGRITPSTVC